MVAGQTYKARDALYDVKTFDNADTGAKAKVVQKITLATAPANAPALDNAVVQGTSATAKVASYDASTLTIELKEHNVGGDAIDFANGAAAIEGQNVVIAATEKRIEISGTPNANLTIGVDFRLDRGVLSWMWTLFSLPERGMRDRRRCATTLTTANNQYNFSGSTHQISVGDVIQQKDANGNVVAFGKFAVAINGWTKTFVVDADATSNPFFKTNSGTLFLSYGDNRTRTIAMSKVTNVVSQASSDFKLESGGVGYAVGDILYVNNHADYGIGKDRIRVTVDAVSSTGAITNYSFVSPSATAFRDDGLYGANEPTYAINKVLTSSTMIGSGADATFKIDALPKFKVSAPGKQHPFYIYSQR